MYEKREYPEFFTSAFAYFSLVFILILLGLGFMYSASYHEALILDKPHYFFLKNQIKFVFLAFIVFVIVKYINFKVIDFFIFPLIALSIVLMLLTLFTPFGVSALGAKRWLEIGPVPSFQPSEIVKVASVLFIAKYYNSENKKNDYIAIFIILFCAGLILLQKDYSTTAVYLFSMFLLLLMCGCDLKVVFILVLFTIIPAFLLIFSQPYRIKRVVSFFFPNIDPTGINYQINNSLAAIKRGGLSGVGFGNGVYKMGRLPEVQNDFVFANIAEEGGFIWVFVFITLFFLLFLFGYFTAKRRLEQNNKLYGYICFGVTISITMQAIVNMMVVTSLLPPTGIPLPFVSQGGTNLFFTIIQISLVYKIISENEDKPIKIEEEKDKVNFEVREDVISKIQIGEDLTDYK